MLIGTVVGNVWSTVKDPTLEGVRFLVVQPFTLEGETAETIVAADPLGAGIGERVLVVFGRAARHAIVSSDCWRESRQGRAESSCCAS